MTTNAHGQLRQSQVITIYGPGALIDLPRHAGIMAGLDVWPRQSRLEEISEPRLSEKIALITGVTSPMLYAPPKAKELSRGDSQGIVAYRFPEWFVVQERGGGNYKNRKRRLVHRKALDDKRRFDKLPVVPTRFVRACPKGHVDDLDWTRFVHGRDEACARQLWLDEYGTTGDLSDLMVRCECGKSRRLYEAAELDKNPLGTCSGARPWLGKYAGETCNQPSRLLIRTATNAYFSQVLRVLSLPARGSELDVAVQEHWEDFRIVQGAEHLQFLRRKPEIAQAIQGYEDEEVLSAIGRANNDINKGPPVKQAELETMLRVPEGYGTEVPIDPTFHARRLPEHAWSPPGSKIGESIKSVIQLHRLREVLALFGFTRLEAEVPDIHGEYKSDVSRAEIALDPTWFPAVENRGEGIFLELDPERVEEWSQRAEVKSRIEALYQGHQAWHQRRRAQSHREFPGGPYILLHTLSHLLIQSLAIRCGYPASSIRERIYVENSKYGILLYTGSSDAEGTLGGLVQQARSIESHLFEALRMGTLCSNDPVCAQHVPGEDIEERHLHGAACHGCTLIAETSCEMRNEYLDRALVVPVLGSESVAFFDRLS